MEKGNEMLERNERELDKCCKTCEFLITEIELDNGKMKTKHYCCADPFNLITLGTIENWFDYCEYYLHY